MIGSGSKSKSSGVHTQIFNYQSDILCIILLHKVYYRKLDINIILVSS